MGGTASPDSEDSIPLVPPFSPVQVMSSLPPISTGLALSSRVVSMMESSHSESGKNQHTGLCCEKSRQPNTKPGIQRLENPTGLSRAEIRLLAEAVSAASDWRGEYLGHPEAEPVLDAFDARITKMKAAIKKLKTASGYNFSGRKKK